jgi:hypothetical protein
MRLRLRLLTLLLVLVARAASAQVTGTAGEVTVTAHTEYVESDVGPLLILQWDGHSRAGAQFTFVLRRADGTFAGASIFGGNTVADSTGHFQATGLNGIELTSVAAFLGLPNLVGIPLHLFVEEMNNGVWTAIIDLSFTVSSTGTIGGGSGGGGGGGGGSTHAAPDLPMWAMLLLMTIIGTLAMRKVSPSRQRTHPVQLRPRRRPHSKPPFESVKGPDGANRSI